MNLEIVEFKSELIDLINKSPLPVVIKQMAVAELLGQLSAVATQEITKEREEKLKKEEVNKDGSKHSSGDNKRTDI